MRISDWSSDVCSSDLGFFRTGDGGYVDAENRLYWEGRLNDIIKTGGANVSPLEIDDVIRAHPAVKITLTVGVPHDTLGEIVVACIVRSEERRVGNECVSKCRSRGSPEH